MMLNIYFCILMTQNYKILLLKKPEKGFMQSHPVYLMALVQATIAKQHTSMGNVLLSKNPM